ncbi:MAG: hypothetical protein PUB98_04280 [Clostridiales bacterium]|nr:hypothetical protein [Clostridiales bacterium]
MARNADAQNNGSDCRNGYENSYENSNGQNTSKNKTSNKASNKGTNAYGQDKTGAEDKQQ